MPDPVTGRRLDQPRRPRTFRLEFDPEAFARFSERLARFLGTGKFLFWQTMVVLTWITLNLVAVSLRWDPYPFILLNLAFSTQAAYAAPLILLAQTRQADRDKLTAETVETRHEQMERSAAERVVALRAETDKLAQLLESNTQLTRQDKELTEHVAGLTREIHAALVRGK